MHCFFIDVPVCPTGTFGQDCSSSCACNTQNSISCHHVSGTCNCATGWEGDACDIDVDECAASSSVTCPAHSKCINTVGGYVCACEKGFYKDSSGLCQGELDIVGNWIFRSCLSHMTTMIARRERGREKKKNTVIRQQLKNLFKSKTTHKSAVHTSQSGHKYSMKNLMANLIWCKPVTECGVNLY